METIADKRESWLHLMETYPSDGWDGAAALIAAHERVVIEHEKFLDAADPLWHDRMDNPPPRRS